MSDWWNHVRCASSLADGTRGNININSPGATIDGVSLSSGDRVLLKHQTTASENRTYQWNSANTALTLETGDVPAPGATVRVDQGTVNAKTLWMLRDTTSYQWSPQNTVVYATDFGAKSDGVTFTNGNTTASSATLTTATAKFSSADVGKRLVVMTPNSPASGTVSTTNGSTTITTSTSLLAELYLGQKVYVNNGGTFTEYTILGATSSTLTVSPAGVGTASGLTLYKSNTLVTTISAFGSSTSITMGTTAVKTQLTNDVSGEFATDCTTAISNAIDSLDPTEGGIVYFPAGTYYFTAFLIDATQSRVTLRGAGYGLSDVDGTTVLRTTNVNASAIVIESAFCRVESMTITTAGAPMQSNTLIEYSGSNSKFSELCLLSCYRGFLLTGGALLEDVVMQCRVPGGRGIHIKDAINTHLREVELQIYETIMAAIDIESATSGAPDTVSIMDSTVARFEDGIQVNNDIGSPALWIHRTAGSGEGPEWVKVSHCWFETKRGSTSSANCVQIDSGLNLSFVNTYMVGGINTVRVTGGNDVRFVECIMGDSWQEPFVHDADVDTRLLGCTIADGSQSGTPYGAVKLNSSSRRFQMDATTMTTGVLVQGGTPDQLNKIVVTSAANRPATPYRSRAYRALGSDQNIADSTYVAVSFTTNDFDYGGIHETATNPSRFTAPADGVYLFTANIAFEPNANGTRILQAKKFSGGSSVGIAWASIPDAGGTGTYVALTVSTLVFMLAGDYVEVYARQTSTVTLKVVGDEGLTNASMIKMSD